MSFIEETITIEKPDEKVIDKLQPKLVLFNDHVNSFDYVIWNLVTYCDHGIIQAEQCATIVHHKGKYAIKHGEIDYLLDLLNVLSENNLTVEIQY